MCDPVTWLWPLLTPLPRVIPATTGSPHVEPGWKPTVCVADFCRLLEELTACYRCSCRRCYQSVLAASRRLLEELDVCHRRRSCLSVLGAGCRLLCCVCNTAVSLVLHAYRLGENSDQVFTARELWSVVWSCVECLSACWGGSHLCSYRQWWSSGVRVC